MDKMMKSIKCAQCGLVNWRTLAECKRCGAALNADGDTSFISRQHEPLFAEEATQKTSSSFAKRALVVICLVAFFLFAGYLSLLATSAPLSSEQEMAVRRAIAVLERRGFTHEAFILNHLVSFRATDNWWNRYIGHSEAYAATNFPFEVVTLYPDFFKVPTDDTERAAVLLHETFHLRGKGEAEAHAEVWKEKNKLGWTQDKYGQTEMWKSVKEDTMTYAPQLFRCGWEGNEDCTK